MKIKNSIIHFHGAIVLYECTRVHANQYNTLL